jgi:hypothetical protein
MAARRGADGLEHPLGRVGAGWTGLGSVVLEIVDETLRVIADFAYNAKNGVLVDVID